MDCHLGSPELVGWHAKYKVHSFPLPVNLIFDRVSQWSLERSASCKNVGEWRCCSESLHIVLASPPMAKYLMPCCRIEERAGSAGSWLPSKHRGFVKAPLLARYHSAAGGHLKHPQ